MPDRTAADESFVCQVFRPGPDGSDVQFECQCVPKASDCSSACEQTLLAGFRQVLCASGGADDYLCGCSVVFLR
ncbi:MAG TPA: hypothetical protein VH062_20880 [Polyangiaceae bacterium]|nr:hypothetical protein [Polyangiaceae bacterium]